MCMTIDMTWLACFFSELCNSKPIMIEKSFLCIIYYILYTSYQKLRTVVVFPKTGFEF